jgi:D-alanine-D-alanine ligase
MQTNVAVFFGGRSPEHDVSVYTGINALESLDQNRYSAFPVYISLAGEWLVGDALRKRQSYIPSGALYEGLTSVTIDACPSSDGRGRLIPRKTAGFFQKAKVIEFDVALLALHGSLGEDGGMQGLMEVAHLPYTGMRGLASSVFMDKVVTKEILRGRGGIRTLPSAVLQRPDGSLLLSTDYIAERIAGIDFPVIVKPVHLGSSVGVSRALSIDEIRAALPPIFKLDSQAIVEPFVDNLVEYYIAARRERGGVLTSAIERPKRSSHVLDFVSKYGTGDDGVSGMKRAGIMTPETLSQSRDINPAIPEELERTIREWAESCYQSLGGTGAPRIDFLSDSKTGELWLNEVNPCPGWYASYLWEAAERPVLYPELLNCLVEEALECSRSSRMPTDPTLPGARMFANRA